MKTIVILCLMTGLVSADYKTDIETWRAEQEQKLRGENSWLATVGLAWLKKGEQSIGSSEDNSVKLPSSAPAHLGTVSLEKDKATLLVRESEGVSVNGEKTQALKSYELIPDIEKHPTELKTGTVTFFAIKRKNGIGIRMKDSAAKTRESFKGRQWYAVDESMKIEGKWFAHKKSLKIKVPDILGNENLEDSPGYAEFTLNGKLYRLKAILDDDVLLIPFCDESCGKESYGAVRYLNADNPVDGKIILDFNKTRNPPCAFTDFATCPLPPKGNRLKISVLAGEKKPLESHH